MKEEVLIRIDVTHSSFDDEPISQLCRVLEDLMKRLQDGELPDRYERVRLMKIGGRSVGEAIFR